MAKNKEQLIADAEALGLEVNAEMTNAQIEELINSAKVEDFDEEETDQESESEDEDGVKEPGEEEAPEEEAPALTEEDVAELPEPEVKNEDLIKRRKATTKVTDVIYKSEINAVRESLKKFPTVQVFVPLNPGEKKGHAVLDVGYNGLLMQLPKGDYLELPKPIADIVMESLGQTASAGEDYRVDGDKKLQDVLS